IADRGPQGCCRETFRSTLGQVRTAVLERAKRLKAAAEALRRGPLPNDGSARSPPAQRPRIELESHTQHARQRGPEFASGISLVLAPRRRGEQRGELGARADA